MAYLNIMVGLLNPYALKSTLFASEEMYVLYHYGIIGTFDGENIALSFKGYKKSRFKSAKVSDAVSKFLEKYVPLERMKDPTIGIWINEIETPLDSFILLRAFDRLSRSKPNVKINNYTNDSEKTYYCEFEERGYTVRFTISEHIIWTSDAILVIEIDPVDPSRIVKETWLTVFRTVLIEVLKVYAVVPETKILEQLFRKYQINIPIE